MADNGSAGSVYRDRRGENPFMPVVPKGMAPKSMKDQASAHAPMYAPEYDSYIGRGTRSPNGTVPQNNLNGRSGIRENPDEVGRRKVLLRQGERQK